MQALLSVSVEIVVLLGAILAFQIAVTLVRSDRCPKWLKQGGMDSMLALILVCVFSFSLAFVVAGLVEVGVPVLAALAFSAGLVVAFGFVSWRIISIWRRTRGTKTMSGPTSGSTSAAA